MLLPLGRLLAVTLLVGFLAARGRSGGRAPRRRRCTESACPSDPGVELRVGNRVVGVATPSQMLTVTKESGDWLWVGRGWLLRDDVVPAEEAQAFFTAEIEREPSAFAYASRSRAWFQTEHFDQALADAEAALRLDPQSAVGFKCRGRVRLAQGDLQGAIDDLNTALDDRSEACHRVELSCPGLSESGRLRTSHRGRHGRHHPRSEHHGGL